MYSSLSFLVYFSACASLFFKLGSMSNIPSLLLLVGNVAILLFAWVHFFRDPYAFGYFRFSFRPKRLAMNHYYVYISVLVCSVVLLTMVNSSFAALIPLLLMLVYTLVYRPYT